MRRTALQVAAEVEVALTNGKPVVALESTIIAHGMPYPMNRDTAFAVEKIVRDGGAVPATIGIVHGEIHVGLTPEQIELFATSHSIAKAGERDIPLAVARKEHAATTAGASIAIAAAAGISVFVTGGIGGVSPTASSDFDISADLKAIEQYAVITVCAGAKAFMDVAATLEYLETLRVPVATYQSDQFPLFYCRESGCRNEWTARDAAEIARTFAVKEQLDMPGGILVGVPLPAPDALEESVVREAIEDALAKARAAGAKGKALTPFLLASISEQTSERSLVANVALIKNNAGVGAEIARALADCRKIMDME